MLLRIGARARTQMSRCAGCGHDGALLACIYCNEARYCTWRCYEIDLQRGHAERCEPAATMLLPRVWVGRIGALCDVPLKRRLCAVVSIVGCHDVSQSIVEQLLIEGGAPMPAHMHVELDDEPTADIRQYLEPVAAFIERHLRSNATGDVLLHCVRGHSRSVTAAVYYAATRVYDGPHVERWRRKQQQQGGDDDRRRLPALPGTSIVDAIISAFRKRRPLVQPNEGFMRVLRDELE